MGCGRSVDSSVGGRSGNRRGGVGLVEVGPLLSVVVVAFVVVVFNVVDGVLEV